jgi:hypothetical protein
VSLRLLVQDRPLLLPAAERVTTEREYLIEPSYVVARIEPVSSGRTLRRAQQPDLVEVVQGADGDGGGCRQPPDFPPSIAHVITRNRR